MFSFFKNKQILKNFDLFLSNLEEYPIQKIKYESVKSLRKLFHEVQIFVMKDMIGADVFLETLKDINVGVATSSNSTQLDSNDILLNFVQNTMQKDSSKYVFHDITKDEIARKLIPSMIKIPRFIPAKNMDELRICRLYAGAKFSGTNIHQHSAALNYLVSGQKLWLTFPYNEHNRMFIERNNMKYGQVKLKTLDWLVQNQHIIRHPKAVKGLKFFRQKRGEVAYVPPGCYHAVINLEDVLGITYSWPNSNIVR
jgi:hypothetical protein